MGDDTGRDWEAYQVLLDLWKQENPIKTTKLQVLLAVNGGLISVVSFSGGFVASNWPLYAIGALLSGVWVLSIGRTVLYQQLWNEKLKRLAENHPGDPRFHARDVSDVAAEPSWYLRRLGGISSKYYLLGAPVVLCAIWVLLLLLT